MSESETTPPNPTNFSEIVHLLETVVPPSYEWDFSHDDETSVPTFNGVIRPFFLPADITDQIGTSPHVRCRVIGAADKEGVAFIVRDINPMNQRVYSFLVKPSPLVGETAGKEDFDVLHGPATWPKRHGDLQVSDLIDLGKVQRADERVTAEIIEAIRQHAKAVSIKTHKH
jgi:hypothetical protein